MEPISLEDERIIAAQLGRKPRGLLGVGCRCSHGYPQVVIVYPLIEKKPFPTIFWLTCPFLEKMLDRLEAEGWVKRMERLLGENKNVAVSLQEAHRSYITERNNLLTNEDRDYFKEAGMFNSLVKKGIGGLADFGRVKCLHMHVAHSLVRENPIGERILQALPERVCLPNEVICEAL